MKDTNVGIKANVGEKQNTYSLCSETPAALPPHFKECVLHVCVGGGVSHIHVRDLKFEKLNNHFYNKSYRFLHPSRRARKLPTLKCNFDPANLAQMTRANGTNPCCPHVTAPEAWPNCRR